MMHPAAPQHWTRIEQHRRGHEPRFDVRTCLSTQAPAVPLCAETEQLRAALAAAHGENLELRRQPGRQHRLPAA
jgi:hypothetical protein